MDDDDRAALTAIGKRVRAHELEAFVAHGDGCGRCRHPVRLRGFVTSPTAGGLPALRFNSWDLPDGVVLKACGSRRESRCPSCARVYRADARHLVRAGLVGGKGVDQSIGTHPAVLLTLTAPSFGPVHATWPGERRCHPYAGDSRCPHGRPLACRRRHDADDPIIGSPLCPDCHGQVGAVLHNACTPELWRRTTVYETPLPTTLRRAGVASWASCWHPRPGGGGERRSLNWSEPSGVRALLALPG